MKTIWALALAATTTMALSAPAQATVFSFSYQAAAGTIAGQIEGTLQADGNTVAVTKVLDFVTFNGVPGIALPWLTTADIIYGGSRAPTATLDGSFVDFAACDDEFCSNDGVIFDPDVIAFTDPVVRTGASFGNIQPADMNSPEPEIFSARKWSLAAVTAAVPEPASWAMMIAGFGLVGAAMRRRTVRVRFA